MHISAKGSSVRNALAIARRIGGLDRTTTRERVRSGGEDGLYRCTLEGDHVVEVTIEHHAKAEAHIVA